jgi:hypothetical protein
VRVQIGCRHIARFLAQHLHPLEGIYRKTAQTVAQMCHVTLEGGAQYVEFLEHLVAFVEAPGAIHGNLGQNREGQAICKLTH